MRKNILSLGLYTLVSLFASLVFLLPVHAITLGISPANIENDQILPGSTVVFPFTFTLAEQTEDMKIVVTNDLQGFEDWVTIEPGKEFIYKQDQKSETINVIVKVPANAEIKNYDGFIRINANKTTADTAMTSVISGARLNVHLGLTNKEVKQLKVTAAKITGTPESSSLTLGLNVNNLGNLKSKISKVVLKVTEMNGDAVTELSSSDFQDVDAFSSKEISVNLPHQLKSGSYFANLEVFFGEEVIYSDKLVLNIAETESGLPGIQVFLDKNMPIVLALLVVAAILVIILIVRFYGAKPSKKAAAVAVFTILPVLGLISYLGYLIGQYNKLEVETVAKSQAQIANETLAISENKEEPQLLGVSTEKDDKNTTRTLTGLMKIYEKMDIQSRVVYYAKEGETFSSAELVGEWYKIEFTDKSIGYLPKSSVIKAVEQK